MITSQFCVTLFCGSHSFQNSSHITMAFFQRNQILWHTRYSASHHSDIVEIFYLYHKYNTKNSRRITTPPNRKRPRLRTSFSSFVPAHRKCRHFWDCLLDRWCEWLCSTGWETFGCAWSWDPVLTWDAVVWVDVPWWERCNSLELNRSVLWRFFSRLLLIWAYTALIQGPSVVSLISLRVAERIFPSKIVFFVKWIATLTAYLHFPSPTKVNEWRYSNKVKISNAKNAVPVLVAVCTVSTVK